MLIDLYVTSETSEDEAGGPDARAERIRDKLGIIPHAVQRVAVAVRRPDGSDGDEQPAWFTFSARRTAGTRPRTGPCAACTRWSPSGWACGG